MFLQARVYYRVRKYCLDRQLINTNCDNPGNCACVRLFEIQQLFRLYDAETLLMILHLWVLNTAMYRFNGRSWHWSREMNTNTDALKLRGTIFAYSTMSGIAEWMRAGVQLFWRIRPRVSNSEEKHLVLASKYANDISRTPLV